MNKLVLEQNDGTILRTFRWSGEPVEVVRRGDTKRLELHSDLQQLEKDKIPFEKLGLLDSQNSNLFLVGELGHLRLLPSGDASGLVTLRDEKIKEENEKIWKSAFLILAVLAFSFISILKNKVQMTTKLEDELKQTVVKIVKNLKKTELPKPQTLLKDSQLKPMPNTVIDKKITTKSVQTLQRMGALSALGSLQKGNKAGGLNLGAATTSAGPGLGGSEGSGGVQTSLYAKGITSAALGAGGNIQGAGGYGTKGKGGGQAGYGQLKLTGSSGVSPVALGEGASVATGLDRDQIAAVITRNLGQVRYCYEQGLQQDANLSGRVVVDFVIGPNGIVKTANLASTPISAIVEDCLMMRLKTWKFPLPEGGVDVKVSYPFILRRAGQG